MTMEGTPDSTGAELRDLLSQLESLRGLLDLCVPMVRRALDVRGDIAVQAVPRQRFEAIQDRRQSWMTAEEVEALNPDDYDLFVDLAMDRLGGMMCKGEVTTLRGSGMRPKEIAVVAKLIENQGFLVGEVNLDSRGEKTIWQWEMPKLICLIRKRLGDDAQEPKLIFNARRSRWIEGDTGYLIPKELKVCLVRRRRRAGGGGGTQLRAV